jgi:hypothetical protein
MGFGYTFIPKREMNLLKANELRKASVIIEENQQTFKEKWNEYFGRK